MFPAAMASCPKEHAQFPLAVFLFCIVITLGEVFVATPVAQAAFDPAKVRALTAFNASNALDLKNYCNGSDNVDDTACIGRWINDAKKQGKHLYVSSGTYLFTDGKAIFKGFHLQCAGPTRAIFKAINNANDLFVLAPNYPQC